MVRFKVEINREFGLDFWIGLVFGIYLTALLWMINPPDHLALTTSTTGTSTFTCTTEAPEVWPRELN